MPKEVNLTGDQVLALTRKYLAAEDVAFIQKALIYAIDCHSGQFRRSGGRDFGYTQARCGNGCLRFSA